MLLNLLVWPLPAALPPGVPSGPPLHFGACPVGDIGKCPRVSRGWPRLPCLVSSGPPPWETDTERLRLGRLQPASLQPLRAGQGKGWLPVPE